MKMVFLKDICKPKQWKTIPTSRLKNDGYPVYGANGIIGYWHEYNHEEPTILVTCRGATCGEVNVSSPKAYITGNAMCLDELDNNFSLDFVEAFLRAYDFKRIISGTAQPQITKSKIGQIQIPALSLTEQKMLTEQFRRIRELSLAGKKILKLCNELVKSRFVEMFGGVEQTRKLEELIAPDTRISYGIVQPGPEGTGDMGVLRPVDIVDGRIRLDDVKRIERSIGDSYRRTELTGDEILTVVRGATGQTVRSNADCATMNVTRGIAVIRYEPTLINPDYLVGYMNSDDGYRYITDHTQGATLQQINIADLKVMPIPIPSMGLQQKFADFVHQVDKLKFDLGISLFIFKEGIFRLSG